MKAMLTSFAVAAAITACYAQSSRQELPAPGDRTSIPFPGRHFPTIFAPAKESPAPRSETVKPDYQQLVSAGDYYLNQKRYADAIDNYSRALDQREEQYPKDQIMRARARQAREEAERKEAERKAEAERRAEAERIPQPVFVTSILSDNHWRNAALVCDVTGSMGAYNNQVLAWLKSELTSGSSSVRRVVLFNDNDGQKIGIQNPATALGLYSFPLTTYEAVVEQMGIARAGRGGSVQENNMHALLRAQMDCPSCESLVMINDNNIPWDFALASQITKPVHMIICGPPATLEAVFLNLARATGGSVHFNGKSYKELHTYTEGQTLKVDNTAYVLRGEEFIRTN